jgi:ABC-type antimicrobial peptide transport system permease subunit
VRTVLERAEPSLPVPISLGEQSANQNQRDTAYQRLADVVILASLPIAGLGLAASIVTGVNERRRPFSLLRLTGTPIAALRRVVAFETAVPLLLVSAAAIGVGFLATALFTHSQLHETMQPPQPSYYAVVAAGLVLTLCIIASTFPLLRRVTGPEAARND